MPSRPPIFRARPEPTRSEQNACYDQRRGTARARGYGARWDKASAGFKREHPLCLGCEAVGRLAATMVTDHVVPHRGDMAIFWDSSRWQPACGWHHTVIKQRLEASYARGDLKADDLWLNSAAAVALTLELRE